jgi:hypothetical protein
MQYLPERNQEIRIIKREDGKSIVYIPKTGKVKILNITGTIILNLCNGKHSAKSMAVKIARQFEDAEEKEIQADIADYIDLLKEEGILHEQAACL